MSRLAFGLALIATLGQSAQAASVNGTVKLPSKFEPHRTKTISGYWKFPNNVLSILPPLIDPRRSMVIQITGKNLSEVPPTLTVTDGQFSPRVLPVPPGTSVVFENKDSTMHLLESKDQFRAKRIGPGDKMAHTFAKAGSYQVRCSEVPHVNATVFVTSGRLALPNEKGEFRFANLDAGQYVIKVWYYGKWIHNQPIAVRGKRTTIDIQLAPRKKDAAPVEKKE